jgi:hypothetical protein
MTGKRKIVLTRIFCLFLALCFVIGACAGINNVEGKKKPTPVIPTADADYDGLTDAEESHSSTGFNSYYLYESAMVNWDVISRNPVIVTFDLEFPVDLGALEFCRYMRIGFSDAGPGQADIMNFKMDISDDGDIDYENAGTMAMPILLNQGKSIFNFANEINVYLTSHDQSTGSILVPFRISYDWNHPSGHAARPTLDVFEAYVEILVTDPNNPDTDGDGMLDGEEMNAAHKVDTHYLTAFDEPGDMVFDVTGEQTRHITVSDSALATESVRSGYIDITGLPNPGAYPRKISTDALDNNYRSDVDGYNVVYANVDGIHHYNLLTNQDTIISTDYANDLRISGTKVVWSDASLKIWLFNITNSNLQQISNGRFPAIDGNLITWYTTDMGIPPFSINHIFLLNLGSDGLFGTSDDSGPIDLGDGWCPSIYGDKVVWHGTGGGPIWLYNATTTIQSALIGYSSRCQMPDVYGNRIVFYDNYDISMYDLGADGAYGTPDDIGLSVISSSADIEFTPRIYGNIVVYNDQTQNSLYYYNIDTKVRTEIPNVGGIPQPSISGTLITWTYDYSTNPLSRDTFLLDIDPYPLDPYMDIPGDFHKEWTYSGKLKSTERITGFQGDINRYLNPASQTTTNLITPLPFNFGEKLAGILHVEPNIEYDIVVSDPTQGGYLLVPGWNLISIPYEQADTNIPTVFSSIDGEYGVIKYCNPADYMDPWKTYRVGSTVNDLFNVDHKMGVWIYISNPQGALFTPHNGPLPPATTTITLNMGWNLIGYPSLSTTRTADNFKDEIKAQNLGSGVEVIGDLEQGDPVSEFLQSAVPGSAILEAGRGYWVKVSGPATWTVNNP